MAQFDGKLQRGFTWDGEKMVGLDPEGWAFRTLAIVEKLAKVRK